MGARTILMMAGGTAGHVMPALAVAAELRARGWAVHWMGSPAGMENRLVAPLGYPMHAVDFAGVRGKGILARLRLPWRLARALVQALHALRKARPDVVLGMGGYITVPGGLAARLLGIPLLVHEQNGVAGSANRLLTRLGAKALESLPGTLPGACLTGNPVRASIAALPDPRERMAGRTGPIKVLVVGGSLGAQALNECVPRAIARLPAALRPQVIHQSGERHLPDLRRHYGEAGVEADLRAFIDDMTACYAEVDLVIGRAGATTVAELTSAGLASILVPFPHAIDDHQTANARRLAAAGAAILVPQAQLEPARLAELLGSLDREALRDMAVRARELRRADATQAVADQCVEAGR
jgi:UDP-N-acetylglucosamine--N-acetylmuramyl-(pentapeptide) pyrophosphoryl-undecaprenol N-acetylglucosamine transferase